MHNLIEKWATVLFVLVLASQFAPPTRAAKVQPDTSEMNAETGKSSSQMIAMPLIAPLFVEDQNFTSTIVLVNSTNVVGIADVTLRNRQGTSMIERKIRVQPKSDLHVPIATLLAEVRPPETIGSISMSSMAGDIAAQLSLTYVGQPTPSYIDEEFAMPMPDSSPTLRAVADSGRGLPVVALTSTASVTEHISLTCFASSHDRETTIITLAPDATVLTNACDERSAGNLETMLSASDDGKTGPIGIELRSDGPPGGFAAFGIMKHEAKDDTTYFSSVSFLDPMMLRSSTAVYVGVPIGSSTFLSPGSYKPELSLANFGPTPLRATVSLATTIGGTPKSARLESVVVPSRRTLMLALDSSAGSPKMQNSFLVTSDGPPGTLISKLIAASDGELHEVELLGKDAADQTNGGHHPWSLRGGSDSVLLLFNHTKIQQQARVTIYFAGDKWQKEFLLKPLQTAALDLQDLVDQQVKDADGKTLPTALSEGVILWAANPESVNGRLLYSNSANLMARSFSCSIYQYVIDQSLYEYVPATISGTTSIDANNDVSMTATGDTFESFYQPCDIHGQDEDEPYYGTLSYTWLDDGPYNSTWPSNDSTYTASFATAGVETIQVTLTDSYGCTEQGQAQLTIIPTISGINTVWWFNGQSPSGYDIQSALTTDGSATWSVTLGASKVTLSSSSGQQITVQSSGSAFSSAVGDIHIVASVNGVSSPTWTMTTRTPASIRNPNPYTQCDQYYGYDTTITYIIYDQLNDGLPYDIDWNEHWTSSANPVYTGENWGQNPEKPGTALYDGYSHGPLLTDDISGPGVNNIPANVPQPTCNANPSVEVVNWGQRFSIGTKTTGAGVAVQTDTLHKYNDHGAHTIP